VRIPVGSFFVSANPAAQNMVATGEKKARLTTDGWQKISVPAACANRPKDIPGSGDSFTVQRSPNQEELATLMPVLNKAGAGTTTKQAAVWIITDNADYDDLGILVNSPGNVRAIGAVEAARAMKICADAGIDITKKRIWNDRETIASKLPAGELKTWLNKAAAAGATGASGQSVPAQSTQSGRSAAAVTPTVEAGKDSVEISETIIAYNHTYTFTAYAIKKDEKGNTVVRLAGEKLNIVPFRNGEMKIPFWCTIVSGVKEYEAKSVNMDSTFSEYSFDCPAVPDTLIIYSREDESNRIKINCKQK
jgi:hypothetical protein